MNRIYSFLLIVLICWGCKTTSKDSSSLLRDVWLLEQAQINSFDPIDAYHAYHIQLTKQLFNTLTDVDATGKVVPSLAKEWSSDDGHSWTFSLREDVLFVEDACFESEEDRSFTAEDVRYTFERLLAPDSQSMGVSYFMNILGAPEFRSGEANTIQGIEVIDNHTIAFTLGEINFNFPNLLSLPYCSIVKEKAVEAYDPKMKPIGTGPFQLVTYRPDKRISLARNTDYWENEETGGEIPEIKRIEILLTTDNNYTFLLFKNKKADFIELNTPLRKQNENTRYPFKTSVTTVESVQLNFYLFNLTSVDDPNVRKGISYALNRDKLQAILGEEGNVTYSLYPKMFSEIHEDKELLKSDGQKAQELLSGKAFRIKMVTFDDILSRSMAARVKEDLAVYGIQVDVESVPFPVLADRLSSGDYDMIQLYWGMLYADPDHFLTPFKIASFPPEGNNFNKYENAEFEELVKTALLKEGEEQVGLFQAAEDVILADMPFVLLYYKNVNMLSNTRFNLPVNPLLYKYYKYACR